MAGALITVIVILVVVGILYSLMNVSAMPEPMPNPGLGLGTTAGDIQENLHEYSYYNRTRPSYQVSTNPVLYGYNPPYNWRNPPAYSGSTASYAPFIYNTPTYGYRWPWSNWWYYRGYPYWWRFWRRYYY